jgi:transposase
LERAWVGLDIGKDFHWAVGLSAEGEELLSRRVENTEEDLRALLAEVAAWDREILWALDLLSGPAALALALLISSGQEVAYLPGLAVNRSRTAFVGEGKTDRRDARVIAENARLRPGLARVRSTPEDMACLRLLVAHRRDLVADRTRLITRLREVLVGIFPGLERVLDCKTQGAQTLLLRYQTPGKLRRAGMARIVAYLRAQHVRSAEAFATRALAAAQAQSIRLPGGERAAALVAEMAAELRRLDTRLAALDEEIETRFFSYPQARIITSLPGMGPRLGAEFLVSVGDLAAFSSPDKLAAYAGLAPVSRDSGKTQGRLVRARGGNKTLKRVFYQAAFASLRHPASRQFYDRKRQEGKRHHQAVLALARRRVNVLFAMLRDDVPFMPEVLAA